MHVNWTYGSALANWFAGQDVVFGGAWLSGADTKEPAPEGVALVMLAIPQTLSRRDRRQWVSSQARRLASDSDADALVFARMIERGRAAQIAFVRGEALRQAETPGGIPLAAGWRGSAPGPASRRRRFRQNGALVAIGAVVGMLIAGSFIERALESDVAELKGALADRSVNPAGYPGICKGGQQGLDERLHPWSPGKVADYVFALEALSGGTSQRYRFRLSGTFLTLEGPEEDLQVLTGTLLAHPDFSGARLVQGKGAASGTAAGHRVIDLEPVHE